MANHIFFALQIMFQNKRDIVTNLEACDLLTRLRPSGDFSFLETARVDTYKDFYDKADKHLKVLGVHLITPTFSRLLPPLTSQC